ncbi:MAG: hypothetical protein LBR80_08630 [Deltaproteobacteria bacterium]|nr:hypothetical protein [Deltaproteobacteria bacterium]
MPTAPDLSVGFRSGVREAAAFARSASSPAALATASDVTGSIAANSQNGSPFTRILVPRASTCHTPSSSSLREAPPRARA